MTEMNKMPNSDDRQKALKEVFLREIREELESDRSRKPSFEEFQKAVAKDRKARRKRHTAIAACFIVALLVGFFAFDMPAYDVDADKNPKEVIQTEDGVIIEDGGYGSSVDEENVWETKDESQVQDAKNMFAGLLVPTYVPEDYQFIKLKVETIIDSGMTYEYTFANNKDRIEIEVHLTTSGEKVFGINDVLKEFPCEKGIIYVQNNKATIFCDDGNIVNIWHALSDVELVKTIEGLE